jgi:hypothetical protein
VHPLLGPANQMKKLAMAVAVVAGVLGLSRFAVHVWRSGSKPEIENIGVRSKVWMICVSQRMLDFVRENPDIQSQGELDRLLKGTKLWYAVVFRIHQKIGFSDTRFSHRLGETPPEFAYTKEVLLTLSGRPPAMFENAKIEIIEQEMAGLWSFDEDEGPTSP